MAMSLHKAGYRPDIDGLRAVAILGVILFHVDERLLPGGFLGVDVFFVISGFLISGIIQRSIAAGNFSILGFYERRIRRLMPALFVLIAVVSVPCIIWMWPEDLKDYAKSVKSVVLPLANIYFLNSLGDYFNEGAKGALLLHTWSLAVEEQFYLVFPMLMLLLNRFLKRGPAMLVLLWVATLVSFGLCIWRGMESPMSAFFLLPFRAWEMLAGVLLSLHAPRVTKPGFAALLGWVGMALVIGSFLMVGADNLVPGLSSAPACIGAVLLILSGSAGCGVPARLLSSAPVVGLGLISYSVYLWHWPLIVLWKSLVGDVSLAGGAALVSGSIFLGWVSWRWIEQPFRTPTPAKRVRVLAVWAGITVGMVLLSQAVRNARGFPSRFPEDVRSILEFAKKEEKYTTRTKESYDPEIAPLFGDQSVEPTIAVWGDSHAEALLPALDRMGAARKMSFRIYSSPGQIPVPGMTTKGEYEAKRERHSVEVLEKLLSDEAIGTVVLHARWSMAIYGDIGEEKLQSFYGADFRSRGEVLAAYESGVGNVVSRLREAGKRVVIIYPVPELKIKVPALLAKEVHEGKSVTRRIRCDDFHRRNGEVMSWFDALRDGESLIRIKPHELLLEDEMVIISDAGLPLYRDAHHLSSAGADYMESLLTPIFESY